jgi:hypothetical protein
VFGLAAAPARSEPPAGVESWLPRLRVGLWVQVEGPLTSAGVVEAAEIKILDGELDEWQIESYVAAVDADRGTLMTTLGLPVVVTLKTLMKGPKKKDRVTFAFVGVDDKVEVEGKLQKDGTMLADELEVEKSKKRDPDLAPVNEHEIRGRIEKVDAARYQVVLLGFTVQLSDKTRNKTSFVE